MYFSVTLVSYSLYLLDTHDNSYVMVSEVAAGRDCEAGPQSSTENLLSRNR